METKLIPDKKQWNDWLVANGGSFTQSWEWGEVLIAEGKEVERLAVLDGEQVLAQAQVVYSRIIFGWQYAACPKGPVVVSSIKYQVSSIYEQFKKYFLSKGCIFFRIEPDVLNTEYLIPNTKKTIDINPSATLILDLHKTEEELMTGMHQKTRYNIHLAEKKNLKISQEKNLEVFWNLMNKTGSRDKFSLHNKTHYAKVLQSPIIYQLTAYFNNVPVATAVFAKFGNTFIYLYGASDYAHRELMAPYLLQWEGVKMGKSLGCERYDFFGVAPQHPPFVIPTTHSLRSVQAPEESLSQPTNGQRSLVAARLARDDNYDYDPKHQYAGVTRFKLGFGGRPQQSVGTWDIVVAKNKYRIYNFLRKLRRLF